MSLFKKRVDFTQFLADLISHQCDFIAAQFDRVMDLAGEGIVLTKDDREQFREKSEALTVADILMRCSQYFCKDITSEEAGMAVSIVYGKKYWLEYKKAPMACVDQKMARLMALIHLVDKAEKEGTANSARRTDDPVAYHLCSGFAKYCAGEDMKAPGWEGKHLAAFKLATALVGGNIVANALRECKVTF